MQIIIIINHNQFHHTGKSQIWRYVQKLVGILVFQDCTQGRYVSMFYNPPLDLSLSFTLVG